MTPRNLALEQNPQRKVDEADHVHALQHPHLDPRVRANVLLEVPLRIPEELAIEALMEGWAPRVVHRPAVQSDPCGGLLM